VAQGSLEPGQAPKEPIMRGPPAHHLPDARNELELWTIAGPSIALQMRKGAECLRDQGSPVPGGVVDHEHDPRIVGRRIGPSDISHVPRKACLQGALSRPARLGLRVGSRLLDQAGGSPPRHEVARTKDVHQIVAVQVAHERPMPSKAQGRPHGGKHGEARLILTAQHPFPRLGFC
jgi:hypothetical protein